MENKYAIIENSIVTNIVLASPEFAQSQDWVLTPEYVDGMAVGTGWGYVDGQFIHPVPSDYSAQNKEQAESLLQETDWTEFPSVADIDKNPHLVNLNEFINYRVALRGIAVNPPKTQGFNFPTKPVEQWSS